MCLILAPIKNEPASIITEPESITEPAPNITKPITVLKQLLLMLQIFTNVSSHPMIRDPMRCECIICIIEAGSFFIGASSVIDPSTNEEGGGIIFGSPHYRAIKQFCICWGIGGNPQFKMVY